MDVKKFLRQAVELDALIDSHMKERDRYRQLSMTISSSRLEEHVSHSTPTEAPYAKWVECLVDKEREIDKEIDRLVSLKVEIDSFIDSVGNPKWQRILRSRYVMCMPWADVAEEMNCSLRHIQRIHKKILEDLGAGTA